MALTQANIVAAFNEAAARQQRGELLASAELWQQIVAAAPTSAEAWHNFGNVALALERFTDAVRAHRRAANLRPDAVWATAGLAGMLHKQGQWREAEPVYAHSLALTPNDPRLRVDYGHLLLGLGDFARGWPLYEARMDVANHGAERLELPNEWRGEPVAGKRVLIWPEQGFGDQIQFVRYALTLKAAGADVTVVCPPELLALFSELPVTVAERAGSTTFAAPDYWTLALSAPRHLGVTMADISGEPYLRAPADRSAKWAGYAPAGSVGVAWRGRSTHGNDQSRSLPSAQSLDPLRRAGAHLIDLTEPLGDFADLAAVVEQLDLVVTVDTALGHLAGALGKPCWVMLPWLRQDWRWFQERNDSPWYANHRLFRQPAGGGWSGVVEQVTKAWVEERRLVGR